jgi:hypothetical protein
MPLLKAEAEKLSNDSLERGVIEEVIERDDLFALLPFTNINGKAYTYNREDTIAEGAFLGVNEDVPESTSTFTEHTAVLKILAGDVDIDKFLIATMGDHNDQVAIQLAQKAKGLGRQFRRTMFTGDSTVNPKEFSGLAKLVDSDQEITVNANGAALSLSQLDELKDAIPNGPDCFMMRKGTYRAYKSLLRATGGIEPAHIMIKDFGMVPAHDGVPILLSDFIPGDVAQGSSANTTSIWAGRFNEADGLHGIVGGGMGGFNTEYIGTVQNRDAVRYRMKWYVSMVLKSTKSLARLKGITNV